MSAGNHIVQNKGSVICSLCAGWPGRNKEQAEGKQKEEKGSKLDVGWCRWRPISKEDSSMAVGCEIKGLFFFGVRALWTTKLVLSCLALRLYGLSDYWFFLFYHRTVWLVKLQGPRTLQWGSADCPLEGLSCLSLVLCRLPNERPLLFCHRAVWTVKWTYEGSLLFHSRAVWTVR